MKTNERPARALRGQRGFTLLETVIAMAILSFGILTVCMMQTSALRSSTTAFQRTEAASLALALVEALQQLPKDDPMLQPTGTATKSHFGNEDGSDRKLRHAILNGNLDDRENAHLCRASGSGKCVSDSGGTTKLEDMLSTAFTVVPQGQKKPYGEDWEEGDVIDRTGNHFNLRWAVQNVVLDDANAEPTDWIIRVHMRWKTPMGIWNHLEYTTNKYAGEI